MKKANLDERELWIRGEVFKHSLLFMGFLLILKVILSGSGIVPVDMEWADILIISLTVAFGNIKMALKGAFDFDDKRMVFFAVIMSVCGLITLVINIFHIFGGEGIVAGSQLTRTGTSLIMSITFLAIPVLFFVKRSQYRRQQQLAETEEVI